MVGLQVQMNTKAEVVPLPEKLQSNATELMGESQQLALASSACHTHMRDGCLQLAILSDVIGDCQSTFASAFVSFMVTLHEPQVHKSTCADVEV